MIRKHLVIYLYLFGFVKAVVKYLRYFYFLDINLFCKILIKLYTKFDCACYIIFLKK